MLSIEIVFPSARRDELWVVEPLTASASALIGIILSKLEQAVPRLYSARNAFA